jgi:hypothetical protein
MTQVVAIRTHKWGEDAQRLHDTLKPIFGNDLLVVFHNRPKDLVLSSRIVDIDDAWVKANGLRAVPDWGWRCGDYFLYAVRQARPDAEFYWLVEPDVYFAGDPTEFFARLASEKFDGLGVAISELPPEDYFARRTPGVTLVRAIFALVRFSGQAVDWLFDQRKTYSSQRRHDAAFLNDECFCFTKLRDCEDLSVASMTELVPDHVSAETMRTNPDIILDMVKRMPGPGIHHPVRSRDSYLDAAAAWMARPAGFRRRLLPSLACLDETDIKELSRSVALRLEANLLLLREELLAADARTSKKDTANA